MSNDGDDDGGVGVEFGELGVEFTYELVPMGGRFRMWAGDDVIGSHGLLTEGTSVVVLLAASEEYGTAAKMAGGVFGCMTLAVGFEVSYSSMDSFPRDGGRRKSREA